MSLQNIKAQAQTLSKVSAFTPNNKVFPILEYYTCTDVEKLALINKAAYNGMTTMVIGTINDYKDNQWSYNNVESQGYIKGKLIKFINEDINFTIVNALSNELYKGVYIK